MAKLDLFESYSESRELLARDFTLTITTHTRVQAKTSFQARTMTAPSRSLFGPHSGQLDNTQPSRVLRHPDAKLSFSSFHPLTASNVPPYNAHQGSSNPKRIVIETLPGGYSHWRFVPRARLAEGVSDEGVWPRLVEVLGYIASVMSCSGLLTCISLQKPYYVRPGPVGYSQA
jgi:hypothetical protein